MILYEGHVEVGEATRAAIQELVWLVEERDNRAILREILFKYFGIDSGCEAVDFYLNEGDEEDEED